jgi:hypothetical protein
VNDSNAGLLSLSTQLEPARKFLVDGLEYEILGIDHLGKADEAEVMARFSKYVQTANALSVAADLGKGTALAVSLRTQRIKILTMVTTLPADIADRLPTGPAVKLIEAVQEEFSENDPDSELAKPEVPVAPVADDAS